MKSNLFLSAAAIAVVSSPSAAFAQARGADTIVVTAQKVEESIQDVPIAVTAFSGDQLTRSNIDEVSDLDRLTPGLIISQSNPARSRVRIRGVGSRKFDVGSDPSIGLFVDEVYVPRFSGLELSLLEVERVEVLKGPQGTLFGRNTPGGAINTISKSASDELEGFVEAGYANKDTYHVKAALSGPITETLKGSISFGQEDRGGFVTNTLTGTTDDTLMRAGRVKLEYEPSDTLRIAGTLQFTETEMDAILGTLIATEPGGLAIPLLAPFGVTVVAPTDNFNVEHNVDGSLDSEALLGIFRVDKDFGDYTVTSLFGYRDSELNVDEDLEKTALDIVRGPVFENAQTYSQELRLTGPNFVVGAFFYKDNAFNEYTFILGADSTATNFPFTGVAPQNEVAITAVDTTSWAIFGQYEVNLTDALTLTVGGRYTEDEKEFTQAALSASPVGPPPPPGPPPFPPGTGAPPVFIPYSFSDELNFESFDPKVSLDYKVNDDAMVFFTYSQGFKSGGVQFTAFSEALGRQTFEPESVNAYEAGFKTSWLDNALVINASGFYYDYEDLQQQRVEVETGGPTAFTQNATTAEIYGGELDASWAINEEFFARFAYAYTEATFGDFVVDDSDPMNIVDATGNRIPATPKHTLFGSLDYNHTFKNDWSINLGTDWYWTSEQNFDVDDEDPFTTQDAYHTGMVRATLYSPGDVVALTVYGQNITDQDYYDQINRRGAEVGGDVADGARYGARLRYTFGAPAQ
ncbi:MAG: TonB-dependent receptor [Pseudomonadota bacterium]